MIPVLKEPQYCRRRRTNNKHSNVHSNAKRTQSIILTLRVQRREERCFPGPQGPSQPFTRITPSPGKSRKERTSRAMF